MKICSMTLKHFRGYEEETTIEFDDLTAIVGKNDVGKSSVLEALDVFFNDSNAVNKLDKDDFNVEAVRNNDKEISISVTFKDLPDRIIIDATNETTLFDEYLLNDDGNLEIIKKYANPGTAKIYVRAKHPTNPECSDLLLKKDTELKRIIDEKGITCTDRTRNAVMRAAIWEHYADDLDIAITEIEINKGDTKAIWNGLQTYLPVYSLFQADRKNSVDDSEVQDPLKEAVKEILNDEALRLTLDKVAQTVERKLREVSDRTLQKLREMSPDVANTLNPVIPSSSELKWQDVFKKVSISGDDNIPINKRGSGTKRLILLNFFRAEVERRMADSPYSSIIYAIEEPETSQHTENQKKVLNALLDLSRADKTQVIITTHSAEIVKGLDFNNIRIISSDGGHRNVSTVAANCLPYPSLNEVNYIAFSEITQEYHNELYGYIEGQGLLTDFKRGRPTVNYIKLNRNGTTTAEQITLSEKVRHMIHHPENRHNGALSETDLRESIEAMREFLISRRTGNQPV